MLKKPDISLSNRLERTMIFRTQTIAFAASILLVGCGNEAPTVDAGEDFEAVVGRTVEFAPTGSDPEDDLLEYDWRFVSTPDGSQAEIMDADRPYAFFVPDVAGVYVAEVVNFDDDGRSEPDTITVTVRLAPVAAIGDLPKAVLPGASILLDAGASVVAPGRSSVYKWVLVSAPTDSPDTDEDEGSKLEITDEMSSQASLAVILDAVGEYVFKLTVADGAGDKTVFDASKTATVFARNPPVARMTATVGGIVGQAFVLDGSASSVGPGGEASYEWVLVSAPDGSTAGISVEEGADEIASIVPDQPGSYSVSLVVGDGVFDSEPLSLTFVADPR